MVYGIAKSMIVNYAAYKDDAPGAAGLELKRQNLAWVLPYHEGAVKAFKEAGVWKPEHEAHQQKALKRQETLAAAWSRVPQDQPARGSRCLPQGVDDGAQQHTAESRLRNHLLIRSARAGGDAGR